METSLVDTTVPAIRMDERKDAPLSGLPQKMKLLQTKLSANALWMAQFLHGGK